jgi:dipeptidyl aminopeptidase/acylaminoacyl peptidase
MLGVKSPSEIPAEVKAPTLASRIKQPIMFYAGADDIRVPREQIDNMVSALERAGNPPKKVLIKPAEGHGYGKLENNVELYNAIIEFLDTTIGPKSGRAAK